MVVSFRFEDFDNNPKVYGFIFNDNVAVSGDFVCRATSRRAARRKLLRACLEEFLMPANRDPEDLRISWIDRRS